MQRVFIILGALLAMAGVALGAFGAHGQAEILDASGRRDTFDTASQYLMYHALAIFVVAWLTRVNESRLVHYAGYLFAGGILFFSGSLYALAVFDRSWLGAVAPIGGLMLISGWACVALAAWQSKAR